jgi:hypothetical protein
LTAFVSTGKISPMVICNGKYGKYEKFEKFAGVNFTILVFSIGLIALLPLRRT